MKKNMTFEKAMTRLEEISKLLESGESPLEVSIKLLEEGNELIDFCQKKLNEAEKKVLKLNKNEDGTLTTSSFDDVSSEEA